VRALLALFGGKILASAKALYEEWKRKQPDVGCHFARFIAFRPRAHGQFVEVVAAKSSPARIAASIAQRVGKLVANPKAKAAVLIFPEIKTLEELAKALLALKGRAGWQVSKSPLAHPTAGEFVTVAISRLIPFGTTEMPSEALVFGPFAEFPPTRRAPVVALEMYVGPPRALDPKTQEASTKANLAHLDLNLPEAALKKMWANSAKGRLKSLGGKDDPRAKAKVSFVLSKALATSLGIGM
jgi:hypothetical protein